MLPVSLSGHAKRYWPSESALASSLDSETPLPGSIDIVTAFFDINRADWSQLTSDVSSKHRRTVDYYFACFDHLAQVSNHLTIFTSPDLAKRALEHRRAHGRADRTTIFTIDGLFETPDVKKAVAAANSRMTEGFKNFVWRPSAPEFNKADYVVINALKSTFACTAIEMGAVHAAYLAWIDFGYASRPGIIEPGTEWRFDFGDKMNLVNYRKLDDRPIYDIVRTSDVYIQGCHIIGPPATWFRFNRQISEAFRSLIDCGMIDDDQTMLLIAYRNAPESFILRRRLYDPELGWRTMFVRFNNGASPMDEELLAVPDTGQPDWYRSLKTLVRRRLRARIRALMAAIGRA